MVEDETDVDESQQVSAVQDAATKDISAATAVADEVVVSNS